MRRVAGTTDPGYGYDLSGNMTNDALNTMTYNGESRVASSAQAGTTTTYTYDGNGLRVKKQVGSATPTVYIFSGTKVIAEYASGAAAGSPTKEYIYSGSALLATIEAGSTKYHIADHLSARVTTDSTGTILGQQGHYPFGEDWYTSSSTTKFRFTSYERDSESGSDYAMFRSHVNRLGRFSSPDPFAGSIVDPQSLNRYAYTLNDPANLIDPLGLNPWFLPASEGGTDAFIGMLLGGGEISRWGIYLGIFCSPVILPDPWNEGMNRFMGWDCGPTQGRRSGGGRGKLWFGQTCGSNPNKLNSLAGDVRYRNPQSATMAFQPWVAAALSDAVRQMNAEGIVPTISDLGGYRSAADQVRAQAESGVNPAARVGRSWHQAGYAVDIRGTRGPQGTRIQQIMGDNGFSQVRGDVGHFQLAPPGSAPLPATVVAAGSYMAVCTAGTSNY